MKDAAEAEQSAVPTVAGRRTDSVSELIGDDVEAGAVGASESIGVPGGKAADKDAARASMAACVVEGSTGHMAYPAIAVSTTKADSRALDIVLYNSISSAMLVLGLSRQRMSGFGSPFESIVGGRDVGMGAVRETRGEVEGGGRMGVARKDREK